MGNMTKGKSSLFKRLNFTSSDFFLYNNFITTYLRNRKNLDKLKNDAAPIQPTQYETITPVQEDDEELVNVEENLNVDEDEYEDIVDETTLIMSAPSRIRSTKNFKLPRLIKKKNTTAPANIKQAKSLPPRPTSQQFVLHNKPPIWNETSQVYQLDFGGRVTQESAKNFQIEYAGKQVMQFGRIDSNAYTLDFEWPFTTVQEFSIALANITQRLK